MSWPGECARRVWMLVGQRRWRRELSEEMRLHRELRGGGARRFGNELRLLERSQAQWGWTWLETWAQDIRHGLRLLRRTPLITALALVSLGLGIGATTALFTLTDAVLLRPLPVSHPERLVWLQTRFGFSPRMFSRLQEQNGLFAGVAAADDVMLPTAGGGRASNLLVSGSYFGTLGLHAERGRLLAASDDYEGCPAIADISDAFWRSHYQASLTALGSAIELGAQWFDVVGVTPPGFSGTIAGRGFDLALPLCDESIVLGPNNYGEAWGDSTNLNVYARLLPGENARQAQARLNAVEQQLIAAMPADTLVAQRKSFRVRLESASQRPSALRINLGAPIVALLGIAGLVWLLACANLTALMLARASARQPEIAMRLALGASRARLVRQLITESILLTLGGLALAWPLAVWACRAAVAFWSMHGTAPALDLRTDFRVLLFLTGLTVATALLMGLWPSLRASDAQLSSSARQNRPRAALGWRMIAGQLALALVLLAAAGLFARSLAELTGPSKGFDARHVLLVEYPVVRGASRAEITRLVAVRQTAMERIKVLPGVEDIAAARTIPAGWESTLTATVWPKADGGHWRAALFNAVSPGYFATLRTPVLQGRTFEPSDIDQPVVIIDSALARMLFPGHNPIGETFEAYTGPKGRRTVRVVGLVADTHNWQLQRAAPPTAYIPITGVFWPASTLFVRTPLSAAALGEEVRHALGSSAAFTVQPFTALMDQGIKPQRMLTWLAALFGGLGVVLAGLGLYGVTAYNALRRRREFGIRVALGAGEGTIARQVLREAGVALAAGLVIGGGVAFTLARVLRAELGRVLYGVKAQDAAAWAGAVALLCAVALLAAWWPARRAARADAMAALREE
ncbi:MAG: FtsX-like permease family protein [Acidobacteria bacterium]|nr:MAG: FtsX-like permease family protein [Acidobacteriota bacterium]